MNTLKEGLHLGISAKAYHADPCESPSLSSGIARKIIMDSIAHAHASHPRLGGVANKKTDAMGLGGLVHSLMDDGAEKDYELGVFPDFKSGDARKWRDAVSASGKSPILQRDLEDATPIASALRAKAGNGSRRDPFAGDAKCEATAIWKEGDAFCRARYDRIVTHLDGSIEVWDWKTAANVSDRGIVRSVVKYGYHIQAAFYLRGLAALGYDRLGFTFVFVEARAPYTVRRVKLTDTFMNEGKWRTEQAIDQWRVAMASGDWSDPRESDTFEAEMPAFMDDTEIEIDVS